MKRPTIFSTATSTLGFPTFIAAIIFTAFLLSGATVMTLATSTSSEAASCGGKNQKPCKMSKKGPQCNKWLHKVKRKCKPCGGKNKTACKLFTKGPQCKPWLYKSKGKCKSCGGKNQRACPILVKGKVCKTGYKKKKGKCKPDANTAWRDHAKTIAGKIEPIATNLSNLRKCLTNSNRKKKLKAAVKDKDTSAAEKLVNQCLSNNMRKNLTAKPAGLNIGSSSAARSSSSSNDDDDE